MAAGPTTIDKAIGKAIYSNSNTFSKNIRSSIRLKKARLRSDINRSALSNRFPDGKHVLKREDLYNHGTIKNIRSKFEDFIEDGDGVGTIEHDGEVYSRGIGTHLPDVRFNFEQFTEVEKLINDEVRELLKSYYGSYFQIDYMKLYRNYHVPSEIIETTEVYSDQWHTDSYQPNAMKIFVNLNDVTNSHGPLHVAPREDTKNIVGMTYSRKQEGVPGRIVEQKSDVIKATGKTGTATFANSNLCLHRASNPAEGNVRDLAMLVFNPSDEPLPENWASQLSEGRNYE